MRQIADLPFIDYDDPAYVADPFTWLADRAAEQSIVRSFRGVELLDYDLCRRFFMDRKLGTDHENLIETLGLPPDSQAMGYKRRMLLTQNRGDTRHRLRKALSSLIGPGEADAMRAQIAGVVSDLVDTLPDGGTVDLKHAFADLVPAGVYCAWVEAPLSDARFVGEMSERVMQIFRRDPALIPEIVEGYDILFDYVRKRYAIRRENLGDDFLSRLIRLHENGGLSAEELEDFGIMLIEASQDNTTHQLCIALDRISRVEGLWRRIAQDASIVRNAIREAMRMWPRSISTSRLALEDTQIADVAIPKGSSVFASFGAVHRQPDRFPDPHVFDMDRAATPHHLNFGGGAFSCLGQFIAQIEVEESVSQLARRFPDLKITDARRDYTAMFQSLRGLEAVLQ